MKKSNKDILKELREIAPGLADLKKDAIEPRQQDGRPDGFTVPYNYFKELPDEVMSRIEAERANAQVSVWDRIADSVRTFLGTLRQPRMAVALASISALVLVGIFLIKPPVQDDLADISTDVMYEYVMENLDAYDDREILTLFEEGDIDLTPLDDMSDEELDDLFDELNTEELNNI